MQEEEGFDVCGTGREEDFRKARKKMRRNNSAPEKGYSYAIQPVRPPRHPRMTHLQTRIDTFLNRPGWTKPISPEKLAEAGFFYKGEQDFCICYHCDLGLKDWKDDDDPWTEHLKHNEEMDLQCYYVNFFKETKKVLPSETEGSSVLPEKPPVENVQTVELKPIAKENECVVCLEKEREVLFIPCRHLGTCKNCAINLRHCPVCRTIVLQTVIIFKC